MLRRKLGIGLVLLLMAGSAVAGYFAANDDKQVDACQELVRALELHVRAQADGPEQFDYPFTDTANCFGKN